MQEDVKAIGEKLQFIVTVLIFFGVIGQLVSLVLDQSETLAYSIYLVFGIFVGTAIVAYGVYHYKKKALEHNKDWSRAINQLLNIEILLLGVSIIFSVTLVADKTATAYVHVFSFIAQVTMVLAFLGIIIILVTLLGVFHIVVDIKKEKKK